MGSMGSSTCYHLAKQGYNVLGLEQFDIPHEKGSHTGQSRLIRKAYFEHPDYVPLLERAYVNWKSIEEETGTQLYHKTGLMYFGKKEHGLIQGVLESAEKYNIEVNRLSDSELTSQYPQFNIPAHYERLMEPDAGFLSPERCILTYTELALQEGANIRTKEAVLNWSRTNGTITVKTDQQSYQCKKLVLTAGAWAGRLLPSQNLKITRQLIAWVSPKKWKPFELGEFPCWTIADDEMKMMFYGMPIVPANQFGEPTGLKFAHHAKGSEIDPDKLDQGISHVDEELLAAAIRKFLPDGYESLNASKTCMYTNSTDDNFIIDFDPHEEKNVVFATGFSGHGFKFASVVGEVLSDLAMEGKTNQPIGFLAANRFV